MHYLRGAGANFTPDDWNTCFFHVFTNESLEFAEEFIECHPLAISSQLLSGNVFANYVAVRPLELVKLVVATLQFENNPKFLGRISSNYNFCIRQACRSGDVAVAQWLCDFVEGRGRNVDLSAPEDEFAVACSMKNIGAMEWLLGSRGADNWCDVPEAIACCTGSAIMRLAVNLMRPRLNILEIILRLMPEGCLQQVRCFFFDVGLEFTKKERQAVISNSLLGGIPLAEAVTGFWPDFDHRDFQNVRFLQFIAGNCDVGTVAWAFRKFEVGDNLVHEHAGAILLAAASRHNTGVFTWLTAKFEFNKNDFQDAMEFVCDRHDMMSAMSLAVGGLSRDMFTEEMLADLAVGDLDALNWALKNVDFAEADVRVMLESDPNSEAALEAVQKKLAMLSRWE